MGGHVRLMYAESGAVRGVHVSAGPCAFVSVQCSVTYASEVRTRDRLTQLSHTTHLLSSTLFRFLHWWSHPALLGPKDTLCHRRVATLSQVVLCEADLPSVRRLPPLRRHT